MFRVALDTLSSQFLPREVDELPLKRELGSLSDLRFSRPTPEASLRTNRRELSVLVAACAR
jgi:hypothetical protein